MKFFGGVFFSSFSCYEIITSDCNTVLVVLYLNTHLFAYSFGNSTEIKNIIDKW